MSLMTENQSLKLFNTFGIDAAARYFGTFSTQEQLAALLATTPAPPLVLGGGSNILLTRDVDGLVLKNEMRGIEIVDEDDDYVYVQAGAGENWHEFVQVCLGHDWAGTENLSLIPGCVGAAPMQNIGAYGVEIKDIFYELQAWNLNDDRVYSFSLNDCAFGYRESVFKQKYRNQFIILNVCFRLRKVPVFHTAYGAIREQLEIMGVQDLSIQAISQAVIRIRQSKLPDPAQLGNAGSFFKNPTIPDEQFERLQAEYPDIIGHRVTGTETIKLAAGWLIDQAGWKGFRRGDAGVHDKQALVLVNYGKATGEDIYNLSEEILQSVDRKFGVQLEREVNII
jgi:UDP-N-acetylmuramate dehydrogenase